jgi:hypothetical protein
MSKYKQPQETNIDEPKVIEPTYLNSLIGSIETVTAVPTGKPTKLVDQFKFYSSGATYRLYVYNSKADVWRYTSLL